MNRINLICLGVADVQRSLAFYRAIGFKTHVKEDNPPIVFFDNQGTKLELYAMEELAKDIDAETPPARQGGFPGFTLACNMKSRAEVDAAIELVREQGGTIVKEPQEVFWGGYSGYFQDPAGYYWEIAHADMWKFDTNDMLIIE